MAAKSPARPRFAYVGCFTTEKRRARGKGVAVFAIDPATGTWTFVHACDAIPNPHYVCLDRTERFLYSAHGDSDETGSYAIDTQTGRLTFLNKQPTGGNNLRPSRSTSRIATSSWPTARASIVEFAVNHETGKLTPTGQVIETGSPSCIVFKTN